MITTFEFLRTWIAARRDDERGASLVEYVLLVALIAVVCIIAISFLGQTASQTFSDTGASIAN
jgi:pilus assembly protein Flp/PilA